MQDVFISKTNENISYILEYFLIVHFENMVADFPGRIGDAYCTHI